MDRDLTLSAEFNGTFLSFLSHSKSIMQVSGPPQGPRSEFPCGGYETCITLRRISVGNNMDENW